MLRPAMMTTEELKLPASLVILTDRSESMSVSAQSNGRSRYDVACGTINASADLLAEIAKQHELLPFVFDSSLAPLTYESHGIKFPEKPNGAETAIGYALQQTLEQTAGKRLLGTILFTDGTQQTRNSLPYNLLPQEIAAQFRDNGTPIYAVQLESSADWEQLQNSIQDIAVQDLSCNERVFLHNELLITGQIRVRGYANHSIPIRLLFETSPNQMTEVAKQEYTIHSSEEESVPFQFRYTPQNAGLCKLTVAVPEQPKELTAANNSLSQFVQVIDGGLNVLYLEGTWRHESTYLRMSLNASPDIRLDYIRIPPDEKSNLIERLQKNHYAAYILGDIDATSFTREDLSLLAEQVRNGAGLILLGGFHSFGAGGYAGTPLDDVSPLEMTPFDRQPLHAEIRNDLHFLGNVRLQPSPQFQSHYLFQLTSNTNGGDFSANNKLWQSLPPFLGANKVRAKQTSQVLANVVSVSSPLSTPVLGNNNSPNIATPLLVTQNYGAGRVLAFATDSTWRWRTRGFAAEHQRFWRQIILWLAKSDKLSGSECQIELEKTRFMPNETVTFRIHARAKNGAEILHPNATAVIQFPDGKEHPVSLTDDNGIMTGDFTAPQTFGDYRINAFVQNNQTSNEQTSNEQQTTSNQQTTTDNQETTSHQEPANATARFLVSDRNMELDNPTSSPIILENLTSLTGGKTITPQQFPQLLRDLTSHAQTLVEQHETKKTLYDTWTFLFLFVAALSMEWWLRKRWGMV
jgi:uncharacterized membrane protein